MAKFKGNTVFFRKGGLPTITPDHKTQTYTTTKKDEIDFLTAKGFVRLDEETPETPDNDINNVDIDVDVEGTPDTLKETIENESELMTELKALSFKQLKTRASKLGWIQKGSASKNDLIDYLIKKLSEG